MNNILLSEEEINIIKKFIENSKCINAIDGIYIEAYKASDTDINPIYVNALYNDSISYKEQLIANNYTCDYDNIENQIDDLRSRYLDYSSRIKFIIFPSDCYCPMLMNNKEISAERSLISGIILFDRFGNLDENKNYVSKFISGFETAVQIENINELISNGKQK